jgi:hypothetical protein
MNTISTSPNLFPLVPYGIPKKFNDGQIFLTLSREKGIDSYKQAWKSLRDEGKSPNPAHEGYHVLSVSEAEFIDSLRPKKILQKKKVAARRRLHESERFVTSSAEERKAYHDHGAINLLSLTSNDLLRLSQDQG